MISVLVVDDSALVRRLVTGVLDEADGISVVGTAGNGEIALRKVAELRPDLVTLDIEMPVMDGLATMRELRHRYPRLPVIMFSTLTSSGAAATLEALAAGASDYVTKPTNGISLTASLAEVRDQLVPRVRALARRGQRSATTPASPAGRPVRPVPVHAAAATPSGSRGRSRPAAELQIIAIGSSTGGPEALSHLLRALPEAPAVPLVIVQHMPPVFTGMLAQRLDRLGPARVLEAQDGQPLQAGHVYIAPGGHHLEVLRRGNTVLTRLHDGEPENFSRPAVDVLFRSVAATYPGGAVAVVLTGMGHDGRDGCVQLARSGSLIVAQDEASSVVWGMPGAVTEAGLADTVLPLAGIAPFLSSQLAGRAGTAHSPAGVAR